jgi:WD40 repeat protein
MVFEIALTDEEKNFFKIYQDILKEFGNTPEKVSTYLELKAFESGIKNLKQTLDKFNEIFRLYLFFKSKRPELEKEYGIDPKAVEVLKKNPEFVEYRVGYIFPNPSAYEGFKWRPPFLLASGSDGRVRIWKLKDGKFHFLKELGEEKEGKPLFELWGKYLFYVSGNILKVYNAESGKVLDFIEFEKPINGINLELGRVVIYKTSGGFGIKQSIALRDGKIVFGPAEPVAATAVKSGEENTLVVENKLLKVKDGQILLFGGAKKTEKIEFSHFDQVNLGIPINDVHVIAEKAVIAPSGREPFIWDLKENVILARLEIPLPHSYKIAKNPGKNEIAVSHNQNLISVWDLDTLQPKKVLESYFIDVLYVDYSPDGRYIAAAGEGKDVNIWNTENWSMEKDLELPTEGVLVAKFSPDGKYLATGCGDNQVYLISTENWKIEKTLSYHEGLINDIAFTKDSKKLISASWDGRAIVWNLETGEVEHILKSSEDRIWKLSLSPDGKFLAVADWSGLVTIYNTDNWNIIETFHFNEPVTALFFSDKYLVMGTNKGTLRTVEIVKKEEIKEQVLQNLTENPSEDVQGIQTFDGHILFYTKNRKLGIWKKSGDKVFSAEVEGELRNIEGLRKPNITIKVLPNTYILNRNDFYFGGLGWENYIQIIKGLEIIEDKKPFIEEIENPKLFEEL